MTTTTLELADRARQSALAMQCVTTADKDAALVALGELLVQHRERVMTANALDLEVHKFGPFL